ncbi:alcohol dehydrogenase catalytic domain-containing protein [Pseudooctadecabacter sp.]|uniref:alcohol dehydrogenase catalytic domain-containing protein n=1 Tax=Pseudooctadecabacter sp. TaxID=1966338 RepID=UPI0035C8507A
MKAIILDAVQTLRLADVPKPDPREGEAIVRVEATGICGADRLAYWGKDDRRPAPLVLGHEAAGVVTGGRFAGCRVVVNPLIYCGECEFCQSGQTNLCLYRENISIPPRQGAFAEYVQVPERNLIMVPQDVSIQQASLIEPLACGWHAARLCRRAFPRGRTALVIGGGAIGLAASLSLKAQGVLDTVLAVSNPTRRAYLRDVCGQDMAPQDLGGAQYDIIIDAVGSVASRQMASAHVRPGGTIGHIGLDDITGGFDMRRLTLHEVTIIGTYTYSAMDFEQTADAAFDGRLGRLDWFEVRPLKDAPQAFIDLEAGQVAPPRIILTP